MKRILTAALAACAMVAVASEDNVVVMFSSVGPDTYRDGTTVVDNEYYALVWTPEGSEFAGINADGSAVSPSKVAVKAPVAKGGKCPPVMFQIDGDYAKSNYNGGTWGVYLLDTRVFKVDADGVVEKDANGNAVVTGSDASAVKGYGQVVANVGTTLATAEAAAAVSAGSLSTADVKISDIAFEGDNVLLTVSGANAGQFELSAGAAPSNLSAEGKDRAATSDTMVIIRPKQAGGEFFSVNRK